MEYVLALCYSYREGSTAAGWRLRNSLFHYRFSYRLTSDKYRFALNLFDCQKCQRIGLTFLQPKFDQDPSLCAFILGIARKSYELPGSTRHFCKGQMPLCYIPNCTQISPCFWWISDCLGEVRGSTDNTDNTDESGRRYQSTYSNIFPSSLCPLAE